MQPGTSITLGTTPAGYCEGCDKLLTLDKLHDGLCGGCSDDLRHDYARGEVDRLRRERDAAMDALRHIASFPELGGANYARGALRALEAADVTS